MDGEGKASGREPPKSELGPQNATCELPIDLIIQL